jgi:hypothetical protein
LPDAPTAKRSLSWDRLFHQATFELDKNRLTISYLTYPFDSPVPTDINLSRAE